MYDSVHLYKNFFFKLLNKKTLTCPLPGSETVVQAQYKHLQQPYKMELGEDVKMAYRLTRALLGLWIFHRLLGGGGRLNAPPPMISAPGRRREKQKAAFQSSRKIFSKSFRHFLAQVKIEVSRGQNSKIFQNGFSTIKSLNLKLEQRF